MEKDKQQELFFNALFQASKHDIELRIISKGIVVCQHFSRDYKEIIKIIKKYHHTANIFFGVFTREGNQGTAENVREGTCIFADVDFKNYQGGQAEADEIFKKFPVKPSLIVHTGNGYHIYWILSKVIDAQSLKNKIESILKGLALTLGSDTSVAEIARILRVPATLNYKTSLPKSVNLVHINDVRYSLDDFREYAISNPKHNEHKTPLRELYSGVSDGARNVSLTRLVGSWVNDGLTFDECLRLAYEINRRNKPPETDLKKIESTVKSIFEKHHRTRSYTQKYKFRGVLL